MIGRIAKKLRRVKDRDEEENEFEFTLSEESFEDIDEIGGEEESVEAKLMERLNEIDNRLPRIDISVNNLKKELNELRNEISRIDGNIQDIMMLYEVVSSQVNPFIGISKVTAVSMEKLERLEKTVEKLSRTVDDIIVDLRLLAVRDFEIDDIVEEVLTEEF